MPEAIKIKPRILAVFAASEDKPSRLALFDVDGTLLPGDTLWDFFSQTHGRWGRFKPVWDCRIPILKWKLGAMQNGEAKELLLARFYKGQSEQALREQGHAMLNRIWPRLYSQALKAIEEHKKMRSSMALVTASPEWWMEEFGKRLGISTVICTRMHIEDGIFSGKFKGANCYGLEKANRIKELFDLNSFTEIHAYGDSKGDREMLALATHPHFRTFKA